MAELDPFSKESEEVRRLADKADKKIRAAIRVTNKLFNMDLRDELAFDEKDELGPITADLHQARRRLHNLFSR